MQDKQLSIKDIAAISGVSIATVSRVLNNKGGYSTDTEKKVMAVANTYGYVSNMAAKTLREARSHTIGLIVPNVNNNFFSSLAYHIETYLYGHNYSVFICNSGNSVEKERNYFRTLAGKGVDGILCISGLNELTDDILYRSIPVVCIDRRPQTTQPIPQVSNDDAHAGYIATRHLLEKGSRHILFISSYLAGYRRADRTSGYLRALEESGLFADKNYILERPGVDPTQIEVEVLLYQFLQKGLPLDGIIASSEPAALGALYALKRSGLSVPQDVRIVSFDNTLYSLLTTPPLSSIERNPERLAHTGCDILLDLIDGQSPERMETVIPVSLVERESSR